MSKRRLGNGIDEVSDAVLGDLEPEQRLQLLLRARADENEQWIDRLVETCPRYDYTAADHAFTDRARAHEERVLAGGSKTDLNVRARRRV